MDTLPSHMRPERSFQGFILALQRFWAEQGCVILQPYDMEMGAGTFHPATTLRALGPKAWNAAYVQPSRRPKDGRYGENPNRLQHYYQFQVIMKPSPPNLQELYLKSLAAIGIDSALHDIRFVEDDWESPTLGAWGLGWECWCDGMEVSQFTYFQQVAGVECAPVAGELTYGLERLAMYVQGVDRVYDLNFNGRDGDERVTYGDVYLQAEQEYSRHNFEFADTAMLFEQFKMAEEACKKYLAAGWREGSKREHLMALPAYDQCIKASHVFNLLDARGVISVTERQSYILRVRELAKACGEAWVHTEAGKGGLMPDLLLELFSEEIPARMQAKAADDLRRMVTDKLVAEGLVYEGAKAFATPRRLALTVHGVPARQPDLKTERRGPKIGAPDAAVQGFLKATGLKTLDEAKIQRDPKGDFYIALIEKTGRDTIDVLAEILPVIVRTFPWPKSMRWGARSAKSGALNWVRPLHAITATFGLETEEPDVVKFAIDGIEAGQTAYGHRFMAPSAISVRRFEDYQEKLLAAKVVLDPERRKDSILTDAKQLAFAQGFELVEDQGLLDEVAGLVEWPVVLMGSFEEDYLAVPSEVIRATIRNNQKCFVVNDPKTGKLANKFVLTANIEASDGGKTIVAGNERVIRSRLSDAKFFYETDLKTKLEDRLPKFEQIIFHEKLGTQAARIARIERLAAEIAPLVGADVEKTKRAAKLAKADLLTEVVGEFPEVQGLMGKYYALAQGEDAAVAAACEEHYKPQGPADRVPTDAVSVAVALADKIDTLVGFWAIDEKPTGSKDPYALRRAALGVIRLILENQLRLPIQKVAASAIAGLAIKGDFAGLPADLLSFFADRLKVQLREQGARHDLVDAVFSLGGQDDLLMVVRRVEALGAFLDSDDGKNLLAGTKRANNILTIEEKKDKRSFDGAPTPALYSLAEEKALADVIDLVKVEASVAVMNEDFAAAMSFMATLRPAVDAFFDKVKVNDDDPKVRENRLKLLNEIRSATRAVADFSKIEG